MARQRKFGIGVQMNRTEKGRPAVERRQNIRSPSRRSAGSVISAAVKMLLKPKLAQFDQYAPRPVALPREYKLRTMPADAPSIAIVTPSFNQAAFIRWAVDSVVDQGYPKLFYTVQDGRSRDDTVAVLRSYGATLDWVSTPDTGQADAINRGFARVQGDIMCWLNSDDMLPPGTLAYVADYFRANTDVDMLYGNRIFIDALGREIGRYVLPAHDSRVLKLNDYVPQETLFWRRRLWDAVGPIDTSFDFALDWDFVLRAEAAGFRLRHVPRFLGCFRVHPAQKTTCKMAVGQEEMQRLRDRTFGRQVNSTEISRGVRTYLLRHVLLDRSHRLARSCSRITAAFSMATRG